MRKTKMGQELVAGLQEALADLRGAKRLRATALEAAEPARNWTKEQIAALRKAVFGVSQPVFATLLSVTVSTVRAWEQGQKTPSGAARRLLEVAALAPEVFVRVTNVAFAESKYPEQFWATHSQVADRWHAKRSPVKRRSARRSRMK